MFPLKFVFYKLPRVGEWFLLQPARISEQMCWKKWFRNNVFLNFKTCKASFKPGPWGRQLLCRTEFTVPSPAFLRQTGIPGGWVRKPWTRLGEGVLSLGLAALSCAPDPQEQRLSNWAHQSPLGASFSDAGFWVPSAVSDSVGLNWGLRICFPSKFGAARLGPTFWGSLH